MKKKQSAIFFSELAKLFDSSHGLNVRPRTQKSYEWTNREFISICSDKPLTAYTPYDFELFKQNIMHRKLSKYGMNHYLMNVKTIWKYAKDFDFIEKNPAERLTICKIPEQKPLYFTRDEIAKLFKETPQSIFKDIFVMAYYSGLRQGEILNLKWTDVDFEKKLVRVSNSDEFTTKTGKERIVPMHEEIERMLLRIKPNAKSKWIFTKRDGWRYQGCYLSRQMKITVKNLGLNPKLRFHSLRHSFASSLSQSGVPIFSISKLLGHSQVSTTMRYAHLNTAELSENISRL